MPAHEPRLTGTKVCKTCGVPKPVIAFSVCRHNIDGLHSDCRSCESEYSRRTPSRMRYYDKRIKKLRSEHQFRNPEEV